MTSCPSCGGTDHTRASSARCLNRKRKLREADLKDDERVEVYTVKRGLASLMCPTLGKDLCNDYLNTIRKDVRDFSRLSIELSYIINFFYKSYYLSDQFDKKGFYELFPKFDSYQFLYTLKDNARKTEAKDPLGILREYKSMNKGTAYEGKLRTYNMIWIVERYTTLLETNITTHAFRRIKRYVRCTYGGGYTPKEVHDRCFAYFYETDQYYDDTAECAIKKWFEEGDLTWKKLKKNYWRYVYLFLHIQKELYTVEKIRSFNVFPIYRHGLKYFQYDSNCLYELMRRAEPRTYRTPMPVFKEDRPAAWRRIFDLSHHAKDFGYCISTDGVAVNLSMNRIVQKRAGDATPQKKKKKVAPRKTNVSALLKRPLKDYDRIVAVDPGAKTPVVTCTRRTPGSEVFVYKTLQKGTVSSWNGERHRRKRRVAITRDIDRAVQVDMEASDVEISAKSDRVLEYTRFHVKWFDRKQSVYESRRLQRLKFDKYMNDQKCIEKIVTEYFIEPQRGKTTLVVYGSGVDFMNRAQFRGHRKFRHDDLKSAIRRRAGLDLIEYDESYTTKTCSHCYDKTSTRTVLLVSKSPHRYVYCNKCRKGIHRDKNGAKNILLKFEREQSLKCPTSFVVAAPDR